MPTRRFFLKSSALAMAGIGSAPLWLARAAAASEGTKRPKVLVTLFQRGAADGLNVVVPHGDAHYYALRPSIAIPKNAVVDLDGFFGLHPAMSALKPLWDQKQLAIVEACGSPDPTRSHFDAQDYMESGTPGLKATRDGWLNRALIKEAQPSPVRAVALGPTLPRSLRGVNPAVSINNLNEFQVRSDDAKMNFESLYSTANDSALSGAGRETFAAIRLLESLQKQGYQPSGGAQYTNSRLGRSLMQIAQLIKANVGLEVAFADTGGWDTHVNEVGQTPTTGQLANLLADFGNNLAAFTRDLRDHMEDVVITSMSEFGRTARENGNRGTDHGHANVMFVFGGGVRGGKVYGRWPGLAPEQLYEGRDLAVTTDFRSVLTKVVSRQLPGSRNAELFPQFLGAPVDGLIDG